MKQTPSFSIALLLLFLSPVILAGDRSSGVEPPELRFASDGLIAPSERQVRLNGHDVGIHLRLSNDKRAVSRLATITLPRFKWRGAADPYPDRHYPELTVRIDGKLEYLYSTYSVDVRNADISALVRSARLDPLAIVAAPPIVDLTAVEPQLAAALRQAGAVREDPDAGDLANWSVQRQVFFDVTAKPNVVLELEYLARPAFALHLSRDADLDSLLRKYCSSTANMLQALPKGLAIENVVVEEYIFDLSTGPQVEDSEVTLDVRGSQNSGAPPIVYAACGAAGASLIGVNSLVSSAPTSKDGRVHLAALFPATLHVRAH